MNNIKEDRGRERACMPANTAAPTQRLLLYFKGSTLATSKQCKGGTAQPTERVLKRQISPVSRSKKKYIYHCY